MAVYLNTYETWQAYGGPEEGGWWYECGTPVQSVLLSQEDYEEWMENHSWEECQELREKATIAYTEGRAPTPVDTGYGGYTFMPGSDEPSTYRENDSYITVIEDSFAQDYPKERPHYE